MHEASLVKSLLHQVAQLLREHKAESAETIRVEMGPLSGVERVLVEIAFAQQIDATSCRGATLDIIEVPLIAACATCSSRFEVERFHFVCPQCGSPQVRVLSGDEFRLLDITMNVAEQSPVPEESNDPHSSHTS